jgi:hypothetical protein
MVESLPAGAAARSPAGAALAMPVASVQFRVSQAARRWRNREGRWRSQIGLRRALGSKLIGNIAGSVLE